MRILKLFVSERKKLWKSILDHIESVESEENKLKGILDLDEEEFNSLINEEDTEMEVDSEVNKSIEESMSNRTFTKFEIKDDNPYDNPSMFLDKTEELNSIMLDFNYKDETKLTPIPKADKKKKKKSSLFQSSLHTIDEFSYI